MFAAPPPGGNPFWHHFGLDACPRLDGQRVLEIGCGKGERCFEMARHGAAQVLGIDTIAGEIAAATLRCDEECARCAGTVAFRHCAIEQLPEQGFDTIVSENALEHIMNVERVLEHMRRKLNPGGKAFIAFGPLYHSPYGDHGWLRAALPLSRHLSWPWGHLIVPEALLFRRLHERQGLPLYHDTHDWAYLDLNKLTVGDYERLFHDSGLEVEFLDTNVARGRLGKAVRRASRMAPFLRKYLTFNLSAVLSSAAGRRR